MSFVDILSIELIEEVFSYLSVPDLVNSAMVCVSWYEASNTSRVWRAAIKRATPKDRFKILSNLDRFTGIASNYDDNHCFQVDRQSPCNLSMMNPWKLSLCQNNFVRRNWSRSHDTVLARHQIKFDDDMWIDDDMRVEYPSKLPQDRLYLPILVTKLHQSENDFLLIRLDGTPRISKKISSTKSKIPIVCTDRDCMVWVLGRHVKYLSLVDDMNSSKIETLGRLISQSGSEREDSPSCYMMTMNDKYIVVGFMESFVYIWCKKTKQLKFTHQTTVNCVTIDCHLYNERVYFKHCDDDWDRCFIETYDIKEEKSLRNIFPCSRIDGIVFNDKYYAILSEFKDLREIRVYEIETNELKITVNVNDTTLSFFIHPKVWIVDDEVLYIEQDKLKILSLVDWSISNGIQDPTLNGFWNNYIWDSFLLAQGGNIVKIWDWKLERLLHELLLDIDLGPKLMMPFIFYYDEIRLVGVRENCIFVIGSW